MDVESRQHLLVEDGVCCEDVAEPLQVNVPVFFEVLCLPVRSRHILLNRSLRERQRERECVCVCEWLVFRCSMVVKQLKLTMDDLAFSSSM